MDMVIVASTNPVKIEAVRRGFAAMFPASDLHIEGIAVHSGVSHQPMNDTETATGAQLRVENAKKEHPDALYWVGIEGGVQETEGGMEAFAWVVVRDGSGEVGKGRTGTFLLPPAIVELIREGKELGEADDIVFGQTNSKQNMGAVGLLTGNVIDRTAYYEHAVILALIRFKHRNMFHGV